MNSLEFCLVPNDVRTLISNNSAHMVDIVDTDGTVEVWHYYRGSVEKNLLFSMPKAGFEAAKIGFDEIVLLIENKLAINVSSGLFEFKPIHTTLNCTESEEVDMKDYINILREYYQISSHLAEIDPEHFDED